MFQTGDMYPSLNKNWIGIMKQETCQGALWFLAECNEIEPWKNKILANVKFASNLECLLDGVHLSVRFSVRKSVPKWNTHFPVKKWNTHFQLENKFLESR